MLPNLDIINLNSIKRPLETRYNSYINTTSPVFNEIKKTNNQNNWKSFAIVATKTGNEIKNSFKKIISFKGIFSNFQSSASIRNKQLEEELLKDLDNKDIEKVITAVLLLGKLNSQNAIPKFTEMLEKNSTDETVSATIMKALLDIGNADVAQPVINLLTNKQKSEDIRTFAVHILDKMRNNKASKYFFDILRNENENPKVRAAIALVIYNFVSIRNTEQLAKTLSDKIEGVRANSALSLGILKYKDATPQIINLLNDYDTMVRAKAARALGYMRDESAIDPLISAMDDFDNEVNISASNALVNFDKNKITPKLLEIIKDPKKSDILRNNVIKCLKRFDDPSLIPIMNTIVANKNEQSIVRNIALSILEDLNSKQSLPILINIIKDTTENINMTFNTISTVGKLGNKDCINDLFTVSLLTPSTKMKNTCLSAIRNILANTEDKSGISQDKFLSFLNEGDETTKLICIDCLGYFKTAQSLDLLMQILKNPEENEHAKFEAINSIGKIGDPKAKNLLLTILKENQSDNLASVTSAALYNIGEKEELFKIINSPIENFTVKNHAAGTLISMGESSEQLKTFLVPKLNIKKLHNLGITGKDIEVSILDDKININHPELIDRVIFQNYSHGTMVAGSLGGNLSGVASESKIYNYEVNELNELCNALEKIIEQNIKGKSNTRVINISIGLPPADLADNDVKNALDNFDKLAKMANKLGITIVVASGNDGRDINQDETIGNMNILCYSDNVIAVGATKVTGDPDNPYDYTRAIFSGYPSKYFSRQLDVMAPGSNITLPYTGGSYLSVNGTSFAAPYVSGVVALMNQVNPDITPEQIKHILKTTAVKLNGVPDNMQGSGQVFPMEAIVQALKLKDPIASEQLAVKLGITPVSFGGRFLKVA